MKNINFKNREDFIYDVSDRFDELYDLDKHNDIAIIAKYEDARRIIKLLLCIGYDLNSIDIHDDLYNGYTDEYIISIANIDGSIEIWCEPMKRGNEYITDESSLIYIMDNCSSKVIPYCKGDAVYEVSIGEERKCNCVGDNNCLSDSEYTYISRGNDGIPTGFRKSWWSEEDGVTCFSSYSHYSNDIDVLRDIAKEFDVKL